MRRGKEVSDRLMSVTLVKEDENNRVVTSVQIKSHNLAISSICYVYILDRKTASPCMTF